MNVWRAVSKPDDIYGVLDRCELGVARDHAHPEPNSGSDCKRVSVGQGKAGLDPRRIDDLGVAVRNDLQWKRFEVTEDALRLTEGPVLGYDFSVSRACSARRSSVRAVVRDGPSFRSPRMAETVSPVSVP